MQLLEAAQLDGRALGRLAVDADDVDRDPLLPGRMRSVTSSVLSVSRAVTGPATPAAARATSVYGLPTRLSK